MKAILLLFHYLLISSLILAPNQGSLSPKLFKHSHISYAEHSNLASFCFSALSFLNKYMTENYTDIRLEHKQPAHDYQHLVKGSFSTDAFSLTFPSPTPSIDLTADGCRRVHLIQLEI